MISHPCIGSENSCLIEQKFCGEVVPLKDVGDFLSKPIWTAHGEAFDQFYDVPAYSNALSKESGKFQCTELVHRFLKSVYDIPTKIGMGLGHANQLPLNLYKKFKNLEIVNERTQGIPTRLKYFENGCSKVPPAVGSIISLNYGLYGHVGIVRKILTQSESKIVFALFEQHGLRQFKIGSPKSRTEVIFEKNSKGYWVAKDVIGWLSLIKKGSNECDKL